MHHQADGLVWYKLRVLVRNRFAFFNWDHKHDTILDQGCKNAIIGFAYMGIKENKIAVSKYRKLNYCQ